MSEMKILCDTMLGSLATWLRLFGFDATYVDGARDDSSLLEKVNEEGRILLTRDKQLADRARRRDIDALLIRGVKIDEQIGQFFDEMHLELNDEPPVVRCPVCNGVLAIVSKDSVKGEIPINVFGNFEEFWRCQSCKKIYWKGTHWTAILERISRLKNKK